MSRNTHKKQQGLVSMIIVIFSAILLTVITISFVTLMTKDQQQATNNDLSQSAKDSALAGVEDAKRLLVLNQKCRLNGDIDPNCGATLAAINADRCNTIAVSGIIGAGANDTETKLQDGNMVNNLDQAYTCVKINTETADYLGELQKDTPSVITLRGDNAFNKVRVSWFTKQDLDDPAATTAVLRNEAKVLPPVGETSWSAATPPLMRAQTIQFGDSFSLADLDKDNGGSANNTFFLSPTDVGGNNVDAGRDIRQTPAKNPFAIQCTDSFSTAGGYSCQAIITLKNTVDRGKDAFLNLTGLYNSAHYKVELLNGSGGVVNFDNVQPEIDSTGRANDLFRRVVSRVELDGGFNFPNAAVTTEGGLCKNFFVTDRALDYQDNSPDCAE